MTFSSRIAPICLPEPGVSSPKYAGQIGVVSGWGMTDIEATETSPVLKDLTVRVTIFSTEECTEIYKDFVERYALSKGKTETEAKNARSEADVDQR